MSKNPEGLANKRLFGKRVTNKDMAVHIAKLYYGDIKSSTAPLTQSEIALTLGFKDVKSIKDYLNLAKELGIQKDKKNDYKLTEYKFLEKMNDFTSVPCIQTWVNNMKTRARGGKPFGGMQKMLTTFKNICDTLQIDPIQWIIGGDAKTINENADEYFNQFMKLYYDKKAKIQYSKSWELENVQRNTTEYGYAKPINDFLRTHFFPLPAGYSGKRSQSISTFHGKYADVRMTISEYREGKKYIIKKWGLDSDIFRWFAIGTEALPRAGAILSMLNDYEIVSESNREFYSMVAVETKTSQYKGGKWKKLIFDEDTKESIRLVKSRSPFVIESYRTRDAVEENIYPKLKEVYRFLNKTHLARRIADDEKSSYFIAHPSHTLRHCGAQIWLYSTDWNVAFVAPMGWKNPKELTDSYGEMPDSMRLKIMGNLNLE